MLNMTGWVTPNHFDVSNFEEFQALSPAQEFDLIAPIMIYFGADLNYCDKAKLAAKELKRLKHPFMEDISVKELINSNVTPEGLENRYNALVMKLVDEQSPEAEAYIDSCGAFGFKLDDDSGVLMGDNSGMFAFHASAKSIENRLTY